MFPLFIPVVHIRVIFELKHYAENDHHRISTNTNDKLYEVKFFESTILLVYQIGKLKANVWWNG